MITVYIKKSNQSSRKAIQWLRERNIPYKLRAVTEEKPLKEEEVTNMLLLSDGIYDIISVRSKAYRESNKEVGDMRVQSELVPFICANPSIIKYPILVREYDIQTGFSEEEFSKFLPREVKKQQFDDVLKSI